MSLAQMLQQYHGTGQFVLPLAEQFLTTDGIDGYR